MGFSGESLKAEKGMYQARLGRYRYGKIEGKRSAWPHVSRCWLFSTRLSESWASSPQHVLYSYCFFNRLLRMYVCVSGAVLSLPTAFPWVQGMATSSIYRARREEVAQDM